MSLITISERILVTCSWLEEHLRDPQIRILDLRWKPYLIGGKAKVEDGYENYLRSHIPGAVFVGCVSDLADRVFRSQGIYLIPQPEDFKEVMERVGVGPQTHVVLYDDAPLPMSSARLWWLLNYYGHSAVSILGGGLREWCAEGRPLISDIPSVETKGFVPKPQPGLRATKEKVKESLDDPETVLIDCRTTDRYKGAFSIWGVREGHIPGAMNLPWVSLGKEPGSSGSDESRRKALNSDEPMHFISPKELRSLFTGLGIRSGKMIITYCGAGYAACMALVALKLAGFGDAAVYEGAIAEWSRCPVLPMEIGN